MTRAARVRSKTQRFPSPSTHSKDEVSWFRNSPDGRAAKSQLIWDRYREQGGRCSKCGQKVGLNDLKLSSRKWDNSAQPTLIHREAKLCAKEGLPVS